MKTYKITRFDYTTFFFETYDGLTEEQVLNRLKVCGYSKDDYINARVAL
jgi:hypothetical protein